jgi:hypothetical protein
VSPIEPMLCDEKGSTYFQVQRNGPISTVLGLGTNGGAQHFPLPQQFAANSTFVLGFTVDRSGKATIFLQTMEDKKLVHRLLMYSKDGELVWNAKLDRLLAPETAVQLDSGDFLILGQVMGARLGEKPILTMGIVDKQGTLQRDLVNQLTSVGIKGSGSEALQQAHSTEARLSDDGNIYILVPGEDPRITVLNQSGNKIRGFSLRPPLKDSTTFDYRVSGSRIFIGFRSKSEFELGTKVLKAVYAAYSPQDGTPMTVYTIGPNLRGALGCINGDETTFVTGTKDGHFAIQRASLK